VASNQAKVLNLALDLHLGQAKKSLSSNDDVAAARKLAGADSVAWMWLNLQSLHNAKETKDLFNLPRNEATQTILNGGILDVARRSRFVAGGLVFGPHGFVLRFKMPAGREGLPAELAAHVPANGSPGSRPLLEPKDVVLSSTYYFDPSKFWEHRKKLFTEPDVKTFEQFDKNSAKFLAGSPFSKLLGMAGPYQRFVVAHQTRPAYATAPGLPIPAFALIIEMREPEAFSKRMDTTLRAAALLATTQVKLKLVEENFRDVKITAYRFPEDATVKFDVNNLRFNFSPSFVLVGNQFVVSSTVELCRELVELLQREAKLEANGGIPSTAQTRVYGRGGAAFAAAFKDRLFTNAILDQAIPPHQAEEQVRQFIALVERLGMLRFQTTYGPADFCYEVSLELSPDGRTQSN
jgi:hypothetical protein